MPPNTNLLPVGNSGTCAIACDGSNGTILGTNSTSQRAKFNVSQGQYVILSLVSGTNVRFERTDDKDCGTGTSVPFKPCGGAFTLCVERPTLIIALPGTYTAITTDPVGTAILTGDLHEIEDQEIMSLMCDGMAAQDPCSSVTSIPPVTAQVTGLPCPLVAPFVWQGATYSSLALFISDVKAQVDGATYNAATCSFSAPAGSVFPALVVSAVPVVPPVVTYCASMKLPDGGYAFQVGDTVDPEATTALATCSGGATGFSIYPSAGVSAAGIQHTVPVLVCGTLAGYAANRSNCAAEEDSCCFDGVISGEITANVRTIPHVTDSSRNGSVITHFWSNGTTTTETVNCGAWVATGETRTVSGVYQEQETNSCCELRWVNGIAPFQPLAPSLALPDGGYAFQTGDVIDPLATVVVPICDGSSMYLYPAAGTGHTIAVEVCGAIAGYAANETVAEKPCKCTITVDGVVQVAGAISITAMPVVRTEIANPAAQVVAAFPANGFLITVFADGTTTTAPLPTQPPCPLTLGSDAYGGNGEKIYRNVDCPPSQRAAYIALGWVQINSNSGVYETLLSPTAQVVCGINFSEPYFGNSGSVLGYTPY